MNQEFKEQINKQFFEPAKVSSDYSSCFVVPPKSKMFKQIASRFPREFTTSQLLRTARVPCHQPGQLRILLLQGALAISFDAGSPADHLGARTPGPPFGKSVRVEPGTQWPRKVMITHDF
jgi:hypothetical protein